MGHEKPQHLKYLECLCVKKVSVDAPALEATVSAKAICVPAAIKAVVSGSSSLVAKIVPAKPIKASVVGESDITIAKLSAFTKHELTISAESDISEENLKVDYRLKQTVNGEGEVIPKRIDKFAGDFGDFRCVQKLFPIADLDTDLSLGKFVGPREQSSGLFNFVDEGVFTGDYHKSSTESLLLADDANSYIQPRALHTDGTYQYKCSLNNFIVRPDNTRFRVRASAPLANYEAKIPPKYTIHNIKFEDPSGNLIVQYDDIIFRGDSDQNVLPEVNYATYSSNAKINRASEYDWERNRFSPLFHETSGYTLKFDVKVEALDDAFDEGFTEGFEEDYVIPETQASGSDYLALDGAPLSTQEQGIVNSTNNIRISAFEICNSGASPFGQGLGPRPENYVSLYLEVPETGRRIERRIYPSFMPLYDFDTGIFPSASSVWVASGEPAGSNINKCGSQQIVHNLSDNTNLSYTMLESTGPHLDSGKLTLKFSHGNDQLNEITRGAFGCAFDQSTCPIWFDPSGAFNVENRNPMGRKAGFFEVESVSLKVIAKKAVGSRNYVLDVVGYSRDELLHNTKAPSGFLQNASGVEINNVLFTSQGTHPYVSGFHVSDEDFALGGTSLSEKDDYFQASGNPGGDHYELTTYPTVSTTEFREYEVPLQIYDDEVQLGVSPKYNNSSLFENLYLDIYPIPSGAAISSAYLLVRYRPQDAFNLSVLGGDTLSPIQDGRSEGKIFPTARGSADDQMLNAGSGYGPLSTITGIPHAYTTPSSIKTNYSRRWRGSHGTVYGPFDPNMFGFGFENPELNYPFLEHYTFTNRVNSAFRNENPTLSGSYDATLKNSNLDYDLIRNVGWRFSSGTLFEKQLPTFSTNYETTDWTSYSTPDSGFAGHELYGKIADAFDNAIRVSGHAGKKYFNISENDTFVDMSGGFSIFMRFTPDQNASGSSYNLFNSGVLFGKFENPKNLDFVLGYRDGYLTAQAKDFASNIITIQDSMPYSGYQYPLSVLLTYNDNNGSGLKLYTDHERSGVWNILRASSDPFRKVCQRNYGVDEPCFDVGWSKGSGVGMNMFVSEFGFSTYSSGVDTLFGYGTNIVESGADLKYKQITAQQLFDSYRAKFTDPGESYTTDRFKLWDFVNQDTNVDWALGDFQYTHFATAFSSLGSAVGKRNSRDFIHFTLTDSGIPYVNKTSLALPTTVDSGVCYHTQMENDFLRFHLSDVPSNFHAVKGRITKNLPTGYIYDDKAIVVETIFKHSASGAALLWPECTPTAQTVCNDDRHHHNTGGYVGPKLIVSLYTKTQEAASTNTYSFNNEDNWGLINRDVHYLSELSGISKLKSTFTFDNFMDKSEKWAIFPKEPRLKDLEERYFSKDLDDMFLQYDLVYPSAQSLFSSEIKIHSSHVKLEKALVNETVDSGTMNIFASGGNVLNPTMNMFAHSQPEASGELLLYTEGPFLVQDSGFNLNILAASGLYPDMNLYMLSFLTSTSGMNMMSSGDIWNNANNALNLNIPAVETATAKMPLHIFNDKVFVPSSGQLDLFTWAVQSPATGIRSLPFNLYTKGKGIPTTTTGTGTLPFNIFGSSPLQNRYPSADMSLFIDTPLTLGESLPLYINAIIAPSLLSSASGNMNLFTANYGGTGSDYLMWYNQNFGRAITQADNVYAHVPVGNEIRGVDLLSFGSCDSNSTSKAIDPPIVTDDTEWRPEVCNDGGIFRAKNTYTNSGALSFDNTTYGYSGNYYGIRKFTGLSPNSTYQTTLKVRTGSPDPIQVPRNFEEWEYGMCGAAWNADDGDCESNIVYSGVKMIGDYPYASGRNLRDQYGKSVAVINDLMAIGAPRMTIPVLNTGVSAYSGVPNAGSVFLYRRDPDVSGEKAVWKYEDLLMLPSGYRKDYIERTVDKLIEYDDFHIDGRVWGIGQEGRKFGSSVDICSSGERETVVIGAPNAQWTRPFDDIVTSGINIGMVVFTDSFDYTKKKVEQVATQARKWDILYKYFSAPWNAQTPQEFQPRIDIQLVIFQLVTHEQDKPPVEHDNPWFRHKYISRMDDDDTTENDGIQATFDDIMSGVSGTFFSMFPKKTGHPHSGIPPILGIFQEDSNSAGLGAFYNPLTGDNVVSKFTNMYKDYALNNGVINPTEEKAEDGYINKILGPSEDWKLTSINLLNTTLATGNLIDNGALDFITSGVGQEWANENAYEFNLPPSSGGRVFIFEKESGGIFNCVQEIKSFADRNTTNVGGDEGEGGGSSGGGGGLDGEYGFGAKYNDRYGHSVSISKNSEVISIGSPYTRVPCEIYERDPDASGALYGNVRKYLVFKNDTTAVARFDELLKSSGLFDVQNRMYYEMSHDDKFGLRIKYNVQLYKPTLEFKYNDIEMIGTWQFIPATYLGSSRLGYSTSVSDHGDIVAFGAPTDSMNIFEDSNVWYRSLNTWASYTNAGAVRIFESKKIYPHSGVVEFTRFGNLDRSVHHTEREQGFYDKMGSYFALDDLPFERTEFEEIEIPKTAGLAFIITPELDAASDEIIQNIKDWLALGDRTLVLVGNDPVYEENGLYGESNEIVNKVLQKLGSRMRIHPARDKEESLPECVSESDIAIDKYNVTEAHLPAYAHTRFKESPLKRDLDMYAKGVGDIRIDLRDINREEFYQISPCNDLNSICNLPLKHDGDLRAEFSSVCFRSSGRGGRKINYKTNWPFHFNNPNPAQECDFWPVSPKVEINRPYEDIVPVLTAGEWTEERVVIIPAKSGERCIKKPCFKFITYTEDQTIYSFAENQKNVVAFDIAEDSDSDPAGTFDLIDYQTFIDPDAKNGRDPLLQDVGETVDGTPTKVKQVVSDDSIIALEELYYQRNSDDSLTKTTSKAVVMASLLGENERSFGATGSDEYPSKNDDQNILFYVNMLKEDCSSGGAPAVLQLGGWTGRTSFKDAYHETDTDIQETNILRNRLKAYGVSVQENVVYSGLDTIPDFYESKEVVLWIANPDGKPTDDDVDRIRHFLNRGNKRIVITYAGHNSSKRQEIAGNVEYLLDKLDFKSRPFFIPSLGEYFVQKNPINSVAKGNNQDFPYSEDAVPIQIVNPDVPAAIGCPEGYKWYSPHVLMPKDTKVEKVAFWPHKIDTGSIFGDDPEDYIPISGGRDFTRILSYNDKIEEEVIYTPEEYELDSQSVIEFPTRAWEPTTYPSGYKMFINWISETYNDHYPIDVTIGPAKFDPQDITGGGQDGFIKLTNTTPRELAATGIEFIATSDKVKVTFTTDHRNIIPEEEKDAGRGLPPRTPRVMSISGCLLEVIEETLTKEKTKKVPCDPPYTIECTKWYEPEKRIVFPAEFRPISHPSRPYCLDDDCGEERAERLIEDGPVIVAEEFEHFSAGTNGNERSKIVVISDSTMIQGQCPLYRDREGGSENQIFIRSLYPKTPSFPNGYKAGGRLFEHTQKLRAPERGSPAKYHNISGVQNTVTSRMWGIGGATKALNTFTDGEDLFHPSEVFRENDPPSPQAQQAEIINFGENQPSEWGLFPRFSGDFYNVGTYNIDGVEKDFLLDASRAGGQPEIMKLYGHDYLDFEFYNSGCPGDLFGYSVDLSQNKLVVGTPFNAFHEETALTPTSGLVQWEDIVLNQYSGVKLSENGGAGAAFYFERTNEGSDIKSSLLPWEFVQKIKPSSLNVGLIQPTLAELTRVRGVHNLDADFVQDHARRGDMFGYSVAIDADMIAVGAPNHDFDTLHEHFFDGADAFLRKEFSSAFAIHRHTYYDLGSSGVRIDQFGNTSGTFVLNNGAVFNYRHEMTDWQARYKRWQYAEKLYPQGYKDRTRANKFIPAEVSGCENDYFGFSVALNRAKRADSDYTLVAGAPLHDFATSGAHPLSAYASPDNGLESAGAAYTFDAMLREQQAVIPAESGWIDGIVFSDDKSSTNPFRFRVYQNTTGDSILYTASGHLVTNSDGEIFLEASGFDPSEKGFIAHRPFVESVIGKLIPGDAIYSAMTMNTFGRPIKIDNAWPHLVSGLRSEDIQFEDTAFSAAFEQTYRPSGLSLYMAGPSSSIIPDPFGTNVYNTTTLPLILAGVSGVPSGTMLLVASSSGVPDSGILNLNIGSSMPTGNLIMNVRGV